MRVPTCLCFDLKTGGFIMGWLGLCEALTYFSRFVGALCNRNMSTEDATPYILLLIASLISLVTYMLLLYGTYKGKHLLLLPVLIKNVIAIIAIAILCILFFILNAVDGEPGVASLFLMLFLFYGGIKIYFFCAIYSLYHMFKEAAEYTNSLNPRFQLNNNEFINNTANISSHQAEEAKFNF